MKFLNRNPVAKIKQNAFYLDRRGALATLYDRLRFLSNFLFARKPLTNRKDPDRYAPFFIIGSGRCGTTLLRALLIAGNEVCIPPESYVLPHAIRLYKSLNFLPWKDLVRQIFSAFEYHSFFKYWDISLSELYESVAAADKENRNLAYILSSIYNHYSLKTYNEPRKWGDKTPLNTFHLYKINQVFPKAKYIHILRDGRDFVSSCLKAGLYDNVAEACQRWILSVRTASEFGEKVGPESYLEIRYEDLVDKPAIVARDACLFLGLDFKDDMLVFQNVLDKMGDAVLPHHRNLANPISAASVGSWKDRLSHTQILEAERILADTLRAFDYR